MLNKKIDREIGYTEKRNKVLEKVEIIKPIKSNKELRKRRVELIVRLWNKGCEEKDTTHFKEMLNAEKNNYFRRMFNGEKINGLSWDQAVDKTFRKPKIEKASSWKDGIKKMFGFSKEDQCNFCGQQLSKKKKKRKKHLENCKKKDKVVKTKFCNICYKSEKFCDCSEKQNAWKNSVRSRYNHSSYHGNGLGMYQ